MDNINKYAKFVSFDEKFAAIISGSAREGAQKHFLLEDVNHENCWQDLHCKIDVSLRRTSFHETDFTYGKKASVPRCEPPLNIYLSYNWEIFLQSHRFLTWLNHFFRRATFCSSAELNKSNVVSQYRLFSGMITWRLERSFCLLSRSNSQPSKNSGGEQERVA